MENPHLQRGFMLAEQGRWDLAEPELRQGLAADPNDALAHAYLALCLARTRRYAPAQEEAEQAIHHGPDLDFAHYAHALVLFERNLPSVAMESIREAIRLNPYDPHYFAVQGDLHLGDKRWEEALTSAEEGLRLDPEHVGCHNVRAAALVKLGRGEEASLALAATLQRAPHDAYSHANLGWACLDRGDHAMAREHFREALRLNPNLDLARAGLVEALKAKNFLYRFLLAYFLWVGKLSDRAGWFLILGLFFAVRLLRGLERNHPELQPFITPVVVLYGLFVLLTWLGVPLFNLLLRLDRDGRYALSRDQILGSNVVGILLLLAVAAWIAFAFLQSDAVFLLALALTILMLPASGIFLCHPGWPRQVMIGVTLLLAFIAAAPFWVPGLYTAGVMGEEVAMSVLQGSVQVFIIGALLSQFLANFLAGVRPVR